MVQNQKEKTLNLPFSQTASVFSTCEKTVPLFQKSGTTIIWYKKSYLLSSILQKIHIHKYTGARHRHHTPQIEFFQGYLDFYTTMMYDISRKTLINENKMCLFTPIERRKIYQQMKKGNDLCSTPLTMCYVPQP